MMKKIIFPVLGFLITIILMQFSYEIFTFSFDDKYPCAEGCSSEFNKFLMIYTWSMFILGAGIGYFYAIKKVNWIFIILIIFIFLLLSFPLHWYASTYGYGLNLSY